MRLGTTGSVSAPGETELSSNLPPWVVGIAGDLSPSVLRGKHPITKAPLTVDRGAVVGLIRPCFNDLWLNSVAHCASHTSVTTG